MIGSKTNIPPHWKHSRRYIRLSNALYALDTTDIQRYPRQL